MRHLIVSILALFVLTGCLSVDRQIALNLNADWYAKLVRVGTEKITLTCQAKKISAKIITDYATQTAASGTPCSDEGRLVSIERRGVGFVGTDYFYDVYVRHPYRYELLNQELTKIEPFLKRKETF